MLLRLGIINDKGKSHLKLNKFNQKATMSVQFIEINHIYGICCKEGLKQKIVS